MDRSAFTLMGYAMRTDRYRYTEWRTWNGTSMSADWDAPPYAQELYDHVGDDGPWTDPNRFETKNEVAEAPPTLVAALAAQLRELAEAHG